MTDDQKTARLLQVATYASRRHRMHDFDVWDLVSFLWLKYGSAETLPCFTYLRLALTSYVSRERAKRRRFVEVTTSIEAAPRDRERVKVPSFEVLDDSQSAGRSRRFEIARMLANGLKQMHVARALGVKQNTVSQTVTLMGRRMKEHMNGDDAT